MSLDLKFVSVADDTGYGSCGISFMRQLYNNYTTDIDLRSYNPQIWFQDKCYYEEVKPMMQEILQKEIESPDLTFYHWTPIGLTEDIYLRPTILSTMFEPTLITQDWVRRCNKVDETWVPSKYCEKTFTDSGVENVKFMPFGMDFSDETRSIEKLDADPRFKFLFINQYSTRKFAKETIQAFLETFSAKDNVVLYIRAFVLGALESVGFDEHTMSNDIAELKRLNPDSPAIVKLRHVSDEVLHRLYNSVDVLVAPSRAEGWGMTIIEAASHEVPAITTNFSAIPEYINDNNGLLLDYKLEHVYVSQLEKEMYYMTDTNMQWATPDYLQLCEYMSWCYDHPDEVKKLGVQVNKDVRAQFDWNKLLQPRIDAMEAIV